MKNSHLLSTVAWLAQACDDAPGLIAVVVEDLSRMARRHRRLCERLCCEEQPNYDEDTGEGDIDRAIDRCEARMQARFAHLHRAAAKLHFQHDCRGGTAFLTSTESERDRYYL